MILETGRIYKLCWACMSHFNEENPAIETLLEFDMQGKKVGEMKVMLCGECRRRVDERQAREAQ